MDLLGAISVARPWTLLLLAVLVPLVAVLAFSYRRGRRDLHTLARMAWRPPTMRSSFDAVFRCKRAADATLSCVAVTCVIVAAAGPRWGAAWVEDVPSGDGVVILVDLSRSMAATDAVPTRLEQGLAAVARLVETLPGASVALIGFSDAPHLLLPSTRDRFAVRQQLAALRSLAPALGGSHVAAALSYATAAPPGRPHAARTVVLVSDGEGSAGDPLAVARRAGRDGIAIVTVPVGTVRGTVVPDRAAPAHTARDQHAMAEIARLSGGVVADPLLEQTMGAAAVFLRGRLRHETGGDPAQRLFRVVRRPRYGFVALIALLALGGSVAIRSVRWRDTF